MKTKVLLLALFLFGFMSYSQNTFVPDDNFEQALIDYGYDTGSLDDYVPTANINTVTFLNLEFHPISDLTGIEDFSALEFLRCNLAQLTSLDLSQNTALTTLYCSNNQLTSLDLSQNTALTTLSCSNNQLTSLDLSQNINLNWISCGGNQLTSLDVRSNVLLQYLYCNDNNLFTLNVKNGNNIILFDMVAFNNPNLTCIEVDDITFSNNWWHNIDPQTSFSEDCSAMSVDDFSLSGFTMYPNPVNDVLTINFIEDANYVLINLNGQTIRKGGLNIGENSIKVSNISSGLYFLKVITGEGIVTKKLIKK